MIVPTGFQNETRRQRQGTAICLRALTYSLDFVRAGDVYALEIRMESWTNPTPLDDMDAHRVQVMRLMAGSISRLFSLPSDPLLSTETCHSQLL